MTNIRQVREVRFSGVDDGGLGTLIGAFAQPFPSLQGIDKMSYHLLDMATRGTSMHAALGSQSVTEAIQQNARGMKKGEVELVRTTTERASNVRFADEGTTLYVLPYCPAFLEEPTVTPRYTLANSRLAITGVWPRLSKPEWRVVIEYFRPSDRLCGSILSLINLAFMKQEEDGRFKPKESAGLTTSNAYCVSTDLVVPVLKKRSSVGKLASMKRQ